MFEQAMKAVQQIALHNLFFHTDTQESHEIHANHQSHNNGDVAMKQHTYYGAPGRLP